MQGAGNMGISKMSKGTIGDRFIIIFSLRVNLGKMEVTVNLPSVCRVEAAKAVLSDKLYKAISDSLWDPDTGYDTEGIKGDHIG